MSTVRRIVEEGHRNNAVFSTPGKHRKGRPRKDLDDFDLCAIRQKIQFFYTVKKQVCNVYLSFNVIFSVLNIKFSNIWF